MGRATTARAAHTPAYRRRWAAAVLASSALLTCLGLLIRSIASSPGAQQRPPPGCIAWRATRDCRPDGPRDEAGDLSCFDLVEIDEHTSGYCECTEGLVTRQHACARSARARVRAVFAPHLFTCERACALGGGAPLPAPAATSDAWCAEAEEAVAEAEEAMFYSPLAMPAHAGTPAALPLPPSPDTSAARRLYLAIDDALFAAGRLGVVPGRRTPREDFVERGERLGPLLVERARRHLASFLARAPAYNASASSGRGVVMCGGGMNLLVPAWAGIHLLRQVGCRLPVELWFLSHEVPTEGMVAAFAAANVVVRSVEEMCPDCSRLFGGYRIKAAALAFSSFREVVFMDADNVALEDPEALFDTEGYRRTGAVLWADYWARSAAPDLWGVLGVDPPRAPPGTHESGQMVIDRRAERLDLPPLSAQAG